MNEDYMLEEDFKVKSAREFTDNLSPDEKDFLHHRSNLKVSLIVWNMLVPSIMENVICVE